MSQNQKGAARGSNSKDIVDVKGDPSKPNSYINIDSNEQKLAAYMVFNYISYLRILLVSWSVLKAVFLFEPIGKNMNKKGAFVLLRDEENAYKGVNPKTAWPLLKDDSKDQIRNKKSRHLACILMQLENDLNLMKRSLQDFNRTQQSTFRTRVMERLKCELPKVDFNPGAVEEDACQNTNLPEVSSPTLLFKGESRLESINRCWNLIKGFKYVSQAKVVVSKTLNERQIQGKLLQKPKHASNITVNETLRPLSGE